MHPQWQSPHQVTKKSSITTFLYVSHPPIRHQSTLLISVKKETRLPNHDAPPDSQTSTIVSQHSARMVPTYVRPNLMLAKGEGSYVWDIENRRYLDFSGGIAVNGLGHSDPEISKLLYQQSSTLLHCSNLYHNPWTGALCESLIKYTLESGGMHTASRAFISNSGTEANEAALKFCRKVGHTLSPEGQKTHLLSFNNSFHGRTAFALSATPNKKYQAPFSPLVPGFTHADFNCPIPDLQTLITDQTCGVIIEPIQGEGGVNVADPDFLIALRKRCTEVGAVLVYDEIQCGMSRTGSLWAHAQLPKECHPDIITTAKALGNGVPIGATIVSEDVAGRIVTGDHGTTFGGNPLACRVGHYVLSRLTEPSLQENVRRASGVFVQGFQRLRERFPDFVGEHRGKGLILGLQLHGDPTPVITAARERGLLTITCGTNTLRFVPSLVISKEEVEEGIGILEQAIEAVLQQQGSIEGTKGQQEMAPPGR